MRNGDSKHEPHVFIGILKGFHRELIGFHWDLPSNNGGEMGYALWSFSTLQCQITILIGKSSIDG
jgi:hypothetical protein